MSLLYARTVWFSSLTFVTSPLSDSYDSVKGVYQLSGRAHAATSSTSSATEGRAVFPIGVLRVSSNMVAGARMQVRMSGSAAAASTRDVMWNLFVLLSCVLKCFVLKCCVLLQFLFSELLSTDLPHVCVFVVLLCSCAGVQGGHP